MATSTLRATLICAAWPGGPPAFLDDPPLAADTTVPEPPPRAELVWSGPERRALQTAALLGLAPVSAPALRDCDHGRWRGRALAEIHALEPEALAAWIADPAARPHGGESVSEVAARVARWLDERCHDHGRMVAVTHPAVIRAAIVHALGAAPAAGARIDVAPWSRTVLTRNAGSWRLRAHGR